MRLVGAVPQEQVDTGGVTVFRSPHESSLSFDVYRPDLRLETECGAEIECDM